MAADRRRSVRAGVLTGIGVAGTVDQVVFHEILHWHHFFSRGTSTAGLVSDGFFHAFSVVMLAAGLWQLVGLARRGAATLRPFAGGALSGIGGFELYDGIVQHKLLGLHQIRYGVPNLWVYDLVWNLAGLLILWSGAMVLRREATADDNVDAKT